MGKKTLFDYFGEIAEILNTACDELHSIDFKKLTKDLTTLIEYYDKLPDRPSLPCGTGRGKDRKENEE